MYLAVWLALLKFVTRNRYVSEFSTPLLILVPFDKSSLVWNIFVSSNVLCCRYRNYYDTITKMRAVTGFNFFF